ncbi:nucleoside phosphorylase [Arcicella aquatica]|uniref:Nucleoside phosphorylase n=1 Tax=Arcicella aquatica TaxID=217141 RepID=A0ABU5QJI5_9BACT|nr:nucleoside phosphorylase [Arcicella aquatica]MEA5257227.1 nucleoside phosphorylase [Arcicella aquatica]
MAISPTDLITNADGSIYHLNLRPDDIADTIITVGDPERVEKVSKYFDSIEFKINKREFVTHTGYVGKKRLSVISSGIGTDNIEILMNELDALANIDLVTRTPYANHKSLNIIRLGTSGSLQKDIPLESIVVSKLGIGFDSLGFFYHSQDNEIAESVKQYFQLDFLPYANTGSESLFALLMNDSPHNWVGGNTVTCPGFYAPQGRVLRYHPKIVNLLEKFNTFKQDNLVLTNLEMETAGYYLMGKVLGHEVLSISAIVASRMTNEFAPNAEKTVDNLIQQALEKLTK